MDASPEMNPDEATPTSIERLTAWARASGFRVASEEFGDSQNQHVVLRSRHHRLEVTKDRGEWSIALGTSRLADLYSPDEWRAWAEDFPLAGDPSSLDDQVDFIVSKWLEVAKFADGSANSEDQLRAIGRDYIEREFAIRPLRDSAWDRLRHAMRKAQRSVAAERRR